MRGIFRLESAGMLCVSFSVAILTLMLFPLAFSKSVAFRILVPEFCRVRRFVEYVGIFFEPKMGSNGL